MIIQKFKHSGIALMLVCSTLIFSLACSVKPVAAAIIVSQLADGTQVSNRQAEMATIRQFLELKMVQEKFKALGIDEMQATEKLSKLSDEEIHQLASQIDKLAVAGDEFSEGEKKVVVYSIAAVGVLAVLIILAAIVY